MLTSQKVIGAINEQIGYEVSAELQYYALAAHFAVSLLPFVDEWLTNRVRIHAFPYATIQNALVATSGQSSLVKQCFRGIAGGGT